jgi:hypothetical protein
MAVAGRGGPGYTLTCAAAVQALGGAGEGPGLRNEAGAGDRGGAVDDRRGGGGGGPGGGGGGGGGPARPSTYSVWKVLSGMERNGVVISATLSIGRSVHCMYWRLALWNGAAWKAVSAGMLSTILRACHVQCS